jgi:hypothetical protein
MRGRSVIAIIIFFLTFTLCNSVEAAWEWQNPLPQGNILNNIWDSSGENIFSVGENGTILHYNGSTWSAMNS